MNIEELIKTSITDHTTTPPPLVDARALAARGRRRSIATVSVSALSAAALVVAGFAGVSALTQDTALQPADNTPAPQSITDGPTATQGPTDLYQYADGRLAVDGMTLPAVDGQYLHVAVNGVTYADSRGVAHLITLDGDDIQLAPDKPTKAAAQYGGWVAADSSQPLVTWTEETAPDKASGTPASVDLVLFDSAKMEEIGRKTLDCPMDHGYPYCANAYVVSDGLVFAFDGGELYGWNPAGRGGDTEEWFPLGHEGITQAHHKTILSRSPVSGAENGGLDNSWSFTPPIDENSLLSYDGAWTIDDSGTITSLDKPGETLTFDPPGEIQEGQFDTDGSVLLAVKVDAGYQVFDCDATTGDCTAISELATKPFRLVNTDT